MAENDLSYDDCVEILRQFRAEHPNLVLNDNVNGIVLSAQDHLVINVHVEGAGAGEIFLANEQPPNTFRYQIAGRSEEIPVHVVETETPKAHGTMSPRIQAVRGGVPALGRGLNGHGTLGWSFIFQGVPMCMSNWQVFCSANATPPGHPFDALELSTNLYAQVASLRMLCQVNVFGRNLWDFALAEY